MAGQLNFPPVKTDLFFQSLHTQKPQILEHFSNVFHL